MTKYSGRSGVMRALKNLTTKATLDKMVANFAFSPPEQSYRFVKKSKTRSGEVQQKLVLNKVSNIEDIISSKGYRIRVGMVDTKNNGGIPFVYLVPKKLKLSQCDKIILYSHGASSDIGTSINSGYKLVDSLSLQMRCSWGIVLWDYPGYGIATEKVPSEKGIEDGVLSLYDFLITKGVKKNQIVAIGRSVGSVPTAYLASRWESHPIAAVVLISPIASAYHAYTDQSPIDDKEDPVGALSNLKLFEQRGCPYPVFIFHGDHDEFIPIEHAQALFEMLRCDQPANVTEMASYLAIGALNSHRNVDIPSESRLWPSISYTVSEDGDTMQCSSCASSIDECLYRERSMLFAVPGAGHNDIMKGDYLFRTLGQSLENIC